MINPYLTRGEYWLLETVVSLPVPISWLNWDELEEVLNKKGHGMDRNLLIKTLSKLFKDGLIHVHNNNNFENFRVLTPDEIEIAVDEDPNKRELFYSLTSKGGEYWEAFALPNWMNYISNCYESTIDSEKEKCILICPKKDHLVTFFNSLQHHEYDVEKDSIKWDVVKPWQATYWKEINIGHKVSFLFEHKDKDYSIPESLNRCFYDRLWYRWH